MSVSVRVCVCVCVCVCACFRLPILGVFSAWVFLSEEAIGGIVPSYIRESNLLPLVCWRRNLRAARAINEGLVFNLEEVR